MIPFEEPAIQLLRDVRALLTPRDHWTQCAAARNADNMRVDPGSPDAVSWCLTGAISFLGENSLYAPLCQVNDALMAQLSIEYDDDIPYDLVAFNDSTSHQAVLHLLDKTIERLLGVHGFVGPTGVPGVPTDAEEVPF